MKPISIFFRKRHIRKSLAIMKGYKILKNRGDSNFLLNLNTNLSLASVTDYGGILNNKILGSLKINKELAVRQYLLMVLSGSNLNKAILYSIGNDYSSIKYPLPKEWRNVLRNKGLKVSEFCSAFNFYLFILTRILYAVFYSFQFFTYSIFKLKSDENGNQNSYVYFEWLKSSNLPDGSENSYDIISWYECKYEQKKNVTEYRHSVIDAIKNIKLNKKEVVYSKFPIPHFFELFKALHFLIWLIFSTISILLSTTTGKWSNGIMFLELVKFKLIKLADYNLLAKEYLFNISGMMYRPLWTYFAEDKGAKITLYFYSTNCELIREKYAPSYTLYLYKIMNWPNYLVWDEYQFEFVKNATNSNAKIEIVGPIWFTCSNDVKFQNFYELSIAVFDVQPVRDFYYQTLSLKYDYYTPEVCLQFLDDIKELLNLYNIHMIHKRKRDIGALLHYKYRNQLNKYSSDMNYNSIDSNIAPQNIIKNCIAVISMPFTSTAIIGHEMHKPSVYYDPTGKIEVNSQNSHGIKVLSGKQELSDWIKQALFEYVSFTKK